MTLVAAAVCPHPPLIVPAVGAGEPVAAREPARAAVRRLLAHDPEILVVVGDDPEALATGTTTYGPGAVGDFGGFGVRYQVPVGPAEGAGDARRLPLSLAVGAWLLADAAASMPRRALGVSAKLHADEAAALGADIVARTAGTRVALLAMGDGSARRTLKAPGWLDERATPFDAEVGRALAEVDTDALLRLDAALADELLAPGRASWQVLAGAARAGTGSCTADLLYADAPYGVGYFVCLWEAQGAD